MQGNFPDTSPPAVFPDGVRLVTCRNCLAEATELGIDSAPGVNFMPDSVYRPRSSIRATLEAARIDGFDPGRLIFEVTEAEAIAAGSTCAGSSTSSGNRS